MILGFDIVVGALTFGVKNRLEVFFGPRQQREGASTTPLMADQDGRWNASAEKEREERCSLRVVVAELLCRLVVQK
jgi:hypothetical protein